MTENRRSRSRQKTPRVLVLSAIAAEAAPALKVLSSRLSADDLVDYVLGVGPLESLETSQMLSQSLPQADLIIYIGSCGEFVSSESSVRVRLCTTDRIYWSPTASRTHVACLVTSSPSLRTLDHLHPCLKSLECIPNFTSPSLTLDPSFIPPELLNGQERCGTENMELFAIAPYLNTASRLVMILGITNHVGQNAHEEWLQNRQAVAEMTAEYLLEQIVHLDL